MNLPLEIRRLIDEITGYIGLGMWNDAEEQLEQMPHEFRLLPAYMELRLLISENFEKWDMAEVVAGHLANSHPENAFYWIEWDRAARRSIYLQQAITFVGSGAAPPHRGRWLLGGDCKGKMKRGLSELWLFIREFVAWIFDRKELSRVRLEGHWEVFFDAIPMKVDKKR